MRKVDMLIIGGGPAGLSAAIGGNEQGIENILIVERNEELGGILNQCIHNGFGLQIFKEELTGPEYSERLIKQVQNKNIPYVLNTMVLDITKDKIATLLSENGVEKIEAKTIVLAMGCREKPRGAINIPGERCAGVFSAGTAQQLVNMKGYKIGKEVVILGSGDIGLIMARRLTFEGAKVKCVIELMPYSSGLKRNIVQCLDDYDIPLKYSSTITDIVGKERIEGVYVAKVDENRVPIKSTEEFISCDTLLLSVGLIPENELTKSASVDISEITNGPFVDSSLHTNIEGIFACGNVLHVHDLVDNVTYEAFEAAKSVSKYLEGQAIDKKFVPIIAESGVRYTVPNYIDINNMPEQLEIKFRSGDVFKDDFVNIFVDGEKVSSRKKRIITPGEMEKIKLDKKILEQLKNAEKLTIKIGGE